MRGRRSRLLLTGAVLIFIAFAARAASAQTSSSQTKPTEPSDDVVRVETNLVQTDVTVIDKKGHVVSGLKPNQFELRVDSKTQPLSFVEEVVAGGPIEETQLKNAREGKVNATPASPLPAAASDRRPLIFFFVDDVHLASESWARARLLLLNFLDHQMKPNDRVAVVSTSGQIGFL